MRGLFFKVLFDTGASHSFISKDLVVRLGLDVCFAVTSLRVANPIGGEVTLSMSCSCFPLEVGGWSFPCKLHVFEFLGFGLILGMDWLSRFDAWIFCAERVVSLRHPEVE